MSERIVAVVLAAKAPTACDPGKRTQDFVERLEFGNSPPFFFIRLPYSPLIYCLLSFYLPVCRVGVGTGVHVVRCAARCACRGTGEEGRMV